jgi:hypothetical protein
VLLHGLCGELAQLDVIPSWSPPTASPATTHPLPTTTTPAAPDDIAVCALVRQHLKLVGLARVGHTSGVHRKDGCSKVAAPQHDHRPARALLAQAPQRG